MHKFRFWVFTHFVQAMFLLSRMKLAISRFQ